jgi:hypothetical protein
MMFSDVAKAQEMIAEVNKIDANIKIILDHPTAELSVTLEWQPSGTSRDSEMVAIEGIEIKHIREALTVRRVALMSYLRNMGLIPDNQSSGWPVTIPRRVTVTGLPIAGSSES